MGIISCAQQRMNRTNLSSSLQKQRLNKESYFEDLKISTKINVFCWYIVRPENIAGVFVLVLFSLWICINVKVLKIPHSVLCGNKNSIPLSEFIAFKGTQLWEMQPALELHDPFLFVFFKDTYDPVLNYLPATSLCRGACWHNTTLSGFPQM